MACETQNIDLVFDDAQSVGVIFDDAQSVALTFNDDVNIDIACAKFPTTPADQPAPEFVGITSWDWSAKSLSGQADASAVTSWTDRHSDVEVVAGSGTVTKETSDGLDAVDFPGGANNLIKSSFSGPTGAFTVFVVAEVSTYVRYSGPLNIRDAASAATSNKYELYMDSGPDFVSLVNRPSGLAFWRNATVFTTNRRKFVTAVHGTTASVQGIYSEEERDSSTKVGAGNITLDTGGDQLQLGAGYNDTGFNGFIHQIIIYDGELSAVQIAEVWAYLEDEWTEELTTLVGDGEYWLASDVSTGAVSSWVGAMGNHTLTTSGGSTDPTKSGSVVQFNGTTNQMETAVGTAAYDQVPGPPDVTFFWIGQVYASSTNALFELGGGTQTDVGVYESGRYAWRGETGGFATGSTTVIGTGAVNVCVARYDKAAARYTIWENNTQVGSGALSTSPNVDIGTFYLGGWDAFSNDAQADFAAVGIIPESLSDDEVLDLIRRLTTIKDGL